MVALLDPNPNMIKIAGSTCAIVMRRDDRIICSTPVGR